MTMDQCEVTGKQWTEDAAWTCVKGIRAAVQFKDNCAI